MKSETELIEELKKSHADAKNQGRIAIRKWAKDNRRKIRKLKKISDKSTRELSQLIGCSEGIFYYDNNKKWWQKKSRKAGKEMVTSRQPSSQPAPDKLKEFGPEFWQGLIDTKKIGDVMAEALRGIFDKIADLNNQIAQLTKERDECRKGWKGAEAQTVQARKELKEYYAIRSQRDQLLAQSVHRALVQGGEKSLNDGA